MRKPSREITARALIFRQGEMLVAQGIEERFTHLVGGHLESGERPEDAVRREVLEETGLRVQDLRFLTTLANTWYRGSTRVEETLHLYEATLWPPTQEARACEPWLEVRWVPIPDLDRVDVRPPAVRVHAAMSYLGWRRRYES